MRKWSVFGLTALLILTLPGCGREERAGRLAALQEKYAAAAGYTASVLLRLVREQEEVRYTLRVDGDESGAKVTVLAPELLAGVTAQLGADALTLSYDGLVLDAGGAVAGLCAANCLPLTLRAVAEGYALEENEEDFADVEQALHVRFESEASGETLYYTVWFSQDDRPLYAEIAKNEEIAIYMEFTSFAFYDTITATDHTAHNAAGPAQ